MLVELLFFFFKQKTAYEMRISDWSSDVCPSDLQAVERPEHRDEVLADRGLADPGGLDHGEFRWHGPSPHEDDGILVRTAARINPRDRGYPGRPRSPPDRKSTRLNSSH